MDNRPSVNRNSWGVVHSAAWTPTGSARSSTASGGTCGATAMRHRPYVGRCGDSRHGTRPSSRSAGSCRGRHSSTSAAARGISSAFCARAGDRLHVHRRGHPPRPDRARAVQAPRDGVPRARHRRGAARRGFDVVVACGVFNLRAGGIQETVESVLPLLFGYARVALHANFLTARAPHKDVELHYVDPAWLLDFAGSASPRTPRCARISSRTTCS